MNEAQQPFWLALQSRVADFERSIARAGQLLGLIGLLLCVLVGLFVSRRVGLGMLAPTLASLAWFTLLNRLWRTEAPLWARVASPLFEMALPSMLFALLAVVQSPEYALGSWVPAQIYCVFIAGSMLRLQRWIPLLTGLMGGLCYITTYCLLVWPMLGEDPSLLHAPPMQLVRTLSLIATGAAGTWVLTFVQAAVGRASQDVRQRDLFGKYQLVAPIASGGMGKVWDAVYCPDGGFQRHVAVKVIHPHLAEDPEFVARFRTEAELGARLAHPNIVAALDFGRVHDTYFFAMEFVDGPTLKVLREATLNGQALSPAIVALIGQQVAEGLHFAHEVARDPSGQRLRVVHRDLSPENLLLDRSGLVKISDFGVARALHEAASAHTLQAVGKPAYMAPEVLADRSVDPKNDLWSLGVVLWELLCGERLFHRGAEAPTMLAVVEAPIPAPSTKREGLPPQWDAVLGALLERDPAQRAPSAHWAAAQLAELVIHSGGATTEELASLART